MSDQGGPGTELGTQGSDLNGLRGEGWAQGGESMH